MENLSKFKQGYQLNGKELTYELYSDSDFIWTLKIYKNNSDEVKKEYKGGIDEMEAILFNLINQKLKVNDGKIEEYIKGDVCKENLKKVLSWNKYKKLIITDIRVAFTLKLYSKSYLVYVVTLSDKSEITLTESGKIQILKFFKLIYQNY